MSLLKNTILTDYSKLTNNGTTSIPYSNFISLRALQATTAMTLYFAGKEPDVLLGFIPLYSVTHFEVGRSHDILQYRSDGATFLAQQRGGNVAIKINMILEGEEQIIIPTILKSLLLYGSEQEIKNEDIEKELVDSNDNKYGERVAKSKYPSSISSRNPLDLVNPGSKQANDLSSLFPYQGKFNVMWDMWNMGNELRNRSIGPVSPKNLYGKYVGYDENNWLTGKPPNTPAGMKYTYDENTLANITSLDDAKIREAKDPKFHITTPDDLKWRNTAWHKTFTLISRYHIIYDVYIETIMERRYQKNSKNLLELTILLRQFQLPDLPEKSEIAGFIANRTNRGFDVSAKEWTRYQELRIVKTKDAVNTNNGDMRYSINQISFWSNALYRTAYETSRYIPLFGNRYALEGNRQHYAPFLQNLLQSIFVSSSPEIYNKKTENIVLTEQDYIESEIKETFINVKTNETLEVGDKTVNYKKLYIPEQNTSVKFDNKYIKFNWSGFSACIKMEYERYKNPIKINTYIPAKDGIILIKIKDNTSVYIAYVVNS